MTSETRTTAEPPLEPLDWESQHFGLSAARLSADELTDGALAAALEHARSGATELVVWSAEGERPLAPELLQRFGGSLVDRKATFSLSLHAPPDQLALHLPTDPAIVPYESESASPALVELAIISGELSRFRVDPRIPRDRFEAMYRIWIERSVRKELADAVLVALADESRDARREQHQGMITFAESEGVASIGLVAVAPAVHGRGIGSALMRAAHRWMLERGATEARVVTQLANAAACRLYERSGYRLARVQSVYHFWL